MKKLFAIAFTLAACHPIPTPNPPPDVQEGGSASLDASRPDVFTPVIGAPCAQACAVLQFVGCPEGDPTPEGEQCASWLTRVSSFPALHFDCVKVSACRDITCVRKVPGFACK